MKINNPSFFHVMRYIFIFLMLCFGCQVFPDIRVRHLPLNGGLSSNMINSIYQDADGMIYFGTASGLNKYDGHSIQTYVNDPADSTSIHDNFVEDIQGFPDGRLLIRAGGTYTLYDPLSDKFNSDISNICHELGVDSYPQSITVDDNDIWCFGRENGIVRFSPKMGVRKVSGIDSCIAEKDLTDLIVSPDHRETYAVTHSGEILIINTSTMTLKEIVKIPDNSTNNLVYTLFMDSDKTIWTFAETGLYAYDRNTKKWIDNFAGTHWPMGKPKAITQDQNGKIWIGYNQEGLAVLDKNGDIEILKNVEDNLSSLPANTVTCLFEDKTGSMWIGTSKKGISIFNQCMYKFEFYKFSDVNCIFATSDGNLLIGTDNNGL